MKAGLVLTTINDPVVLEDYFENFQSHGRLDDVTAYVIIDRKTPAAAVERMKVLKQKGFDIQFPDFDAQESFLNSVGMQAELVPYNSDNRRNIGYLMAYRDGVDFVISIDDDNFPVAGGDDVFGEHSIVTKGKSEHLTIESNDRFFNICDMLEFETSGQVYARGFPYYLRHQTPELTTSKAQADVHINGGHWIFEPDLDAISWLVNPPRATAMKPQSWVLANSTWSPVNTQNTGLRRDAIGAYYFVKMGYQIGSSSIDRYGDIFSGYFVQACTKHLGGAVRFGTPVAEHRRNTHNYMKDAHAEWECIRLLEDLLPWMSEELKLDGSSYLDAFESLSHQLEHFVSIRTGGAWSEAAKGYFHSTGFHMREWIKACRYIDGGS